MTEPKTKKEPGKALVYMGVEPVKIEGVGVVEPGEVIPEASASFALVSDLPDFHLQ
jgi:hypothetical protein